MKDKSNGLAYSKSFVKFYNENNGEILENIFKYFDD